MKVLTEDNATTLRIINDVLRENNLDVIRTFYKQTEDTLQLRIKFPEIDGELQDAFIMRDYKYSPKCFRDLVFDINAEFANLLERMKVRYSKLLKEKEDNDIIVIHIIF